MSCASTMDKTTLCSNPKPWSPMKLYSTPYVEPKAPPQLPVLCVCSALALVEMVSSLPEQEAGWTSQRRICHKSDKFKRNNKFMQIPNIFHPFCPQRDLVKWVSIFGTKLRDGQTMVTAWSTSFMYKILHSSTLTRCCPCSFKGPTFSSLNFISASLWCA